jgi:hypothetical protein
MWLCQCALVVSSCEGSAGYILDLDLSESRSLANVDRQYLVSTYALAKFLHICF